jgi:hypothetical protein
MTSEISKMAKRDYAALDKFYAPCGSCAFCGGPDKRHRLWDMFIDSPDSDEEVARQYDTPVEHIRLVRKLRPYRKEAAGNG